MRDNSSRFAAPEEAAPKEPSMEEQPKAVDLMSFVAPTQFVELPSKGKYYPEGHPLHGKETIEIKFMTAKEEDILASQELIKKGVVLDRLIKSIVVDKRVSPDDMLLGDKTAIMYAARISAYGPEYHTKYFCRSCSNAIEHTFDLNEIKPKDQEDLEVEYEDGHFVCTAPVTGVKVALRLLTGKDEKEMAAFLKKKKKNNESMGSLITQMLYIIHSINGVDAKVQIYNFIQNMPFRDSKYIREVYAKISPSMNTQVEVTCNNCYAEQEVELPMSVEFFWPKQ